MTDEIKSDDTFAICNRNADKRIKLKKKHSIFVACNECDVTNEETENRTKFYKQAAKSNQLNNNIHANCTNL